MVGAWGWRKEKAPVKLFLTTGESLFVCQSMVTDAANVTN